MDENDRSLWLAHATSDSSKQQVSSILGIIGSSCVAFGQVLARSQHEPCGHNFWAIDVLKPTQLPFWDPIGSISTNVRHCCQGTIVCGSEGGHGSDFGHFRGIWRGDLQYTPNDLKYRFRTFSQLHTASLSSRYGRDQLIGQLRHFRLQWSVGRGALEPLRRLVFWCGPRRGENR